MPRHVIAAFTAGLLVFSALQAQAGPVTRLVVRSTTPATSTATRRQPLVSALTRASAGLSFPRLEHVHIAVSPGAPVLCRVSPGVLLHVLRRKGPYSLVKPVGNSPPIQGWIQSSALGLRVLRNAPLFAGPGGRPIGRVRGGSLVHTVRRAGRFMLVEVSAKAHVRVWMQRKDLGTERSRATSSLRYVNGTRRVLKPGPLFASPGGHRVASVVYPAEVRVLARKTWAGQIWLHLNVGVPWHVELRGWVPKKRVSPGFTVPGFGSWYVPNPPGTTNRGGRYVLKKTVLGFAAPDDAYPTVTLPTGTLLDLAKIPMSGWIKIVVRGPGMRCTLGISRADGIWIQKRSSLDNSRKVR